MSECTRVLIVEGALEEARFVEEALAEAQETRRTGLRFECLHLESFEDAAILLRAEHKHMHLVLLGCAPVGGAAIEAFRNLRSLAPGTAIIVMLEPEDRVAAASFLRDGAQDFLLRGQFDYETLARAIENALERQKYLAAAQSVAMSDPDTGLLTANAFIVLGRGMWPLLARAGVKACVVVVKTESAEGLVDLAGAVPAGTLLAARLGVTRLAMLGECAAAEALGALGIAFRTGSAQADPRGCEFEALLEEAEADLSNNARANPVSA